MRPRKYAVRQWSTPREKADEKRAVERSIEHAALLRDRLRTVGKLTVKIHGV